MEFLASQGFIQRGGGFGQFSRIFAAGLAERGQAARYLHGLFTNASWCLEEITLLHFLSDAI